MCLATVYMEEDGQKKEVMRDVARIEPNRDGLHLLTLIGEGKQFHAKIKSIDMMDSLIVLERTAGEPSEISTA